MTYQEVLENARKNILYCKACPVCNGLACANTIPGPGSKAPGNGANDNWKAWKDIKLNIDTFAPDGEVDTSASILGRRLSMPLMTGPIGSFLQYSKEDVTTDFNEDTFNAAAQTGVIATFGDGIINTIVPAAMESLKKYPDTALVPILNPLPNDFILKYVEQIEASASLALGVVVDSAGLRHWKERNHNPKTKTVEELRELKAATSKPFLIKGIMSAKAAVQAVEAGADAIIVSNHGGRVLPDAPATADVLPEIVSAVKGQTQIIVDGGIRTGYDIFKALALGADGALICRPFAVAWFGGGVEGEKVYIEKLKAELHEAMYLCGARSIGEINAEMIR